MCSSFPFDINNRGRIVGEYVRPDSESGLFRNERGRITSFDFPGAKGTEAIRISNNGQIVGNYSANTGFVNDPNAEVHRFLLDHGKATTIDVPGAVLTTAFGVNNRRQVVGYSIDAEGTPHGYLWEKGRFTTLDLPGARLSQPTAINDRGQIVGATGADRMLTGGRGFVLATGIKGPFTMIDFRARSRPGRQASMTVAGSSASP